MLSELHRAHKEREFRLGIRKPVQLGKPEPVPDETAQNEILTEKVVIPIRDPRDETIKQLQYEVDRLNFQLKKLVVEDSAPITVESPVKPIAITVAEYYGIRLGELVSGRRCRPLVRARHVGMYLAKEITDRSFPRIGRIFNKDHTSVIHAVQKIGREIKTDPQLQRDVAEIRAMIAQKAAAR